MATIFKGWQAKIYIANLEIGTVRSVNVTYESPVEPYYEIENPNMIPITSEDQLGLVKISGTLSRAWINVYYLRLLFGGDSPVVPNFEFDLRFLASSDVGSSIIYLYHCRFTKVKLEIPNNGWLEENYDFIALNASSSVVPCPSGEQLNNPGFESDFTNWDYSGYSISTTSPHSGSKCLWAYPSGWIEQTLTLPISVACVDSVSCWVKLQGLTGTVGVTVRYTYTDDTISESTQGTVNPSTWTQLTFGNMTTGKIIKKIKFSGSCSNNPHFMDDCSLVGKG